MKYLLEAKQRLASKANPQEVEPYWDECHRWLILTGVDEQKWSLRKQAENPDSIFRFSFHFLTQSWTRFACHFRRIFTTSLAPLIDLQEVEKIADKDGEWLLNRFANRFEEMDILSMEYTGDEKHEGKIIPLLNFWSGLTPNNQEDRKKWYELCQRTAETKRRGLPANSIYHSSITEWIEQRKVA